VVCAEPFTNVEDVIAKANGNIYGLAAAVWTTSVFIKKTLCGGIGLGAQREQNAVLFVVGIFPGFLVRSVGLSSASRGLKRIGVCAAIGWCPTTAGRSSCASSCCWNEEGRRRPRPNSGYFSFWSKRTFLIGPGKRI